MTALLLSPHQDDCALFSCFLALHHQAIVITCMRGEIQARRGNPITNEERVNEDRCAFDILGLDYGMLDQSDIDPDENALDRSISELVTELDPDTLIFPAVEENGHEQHNMVGRIGERFTDLHLIRYTTYTRSGGRTTGREVVPEPWMIPLKLRALACYESQILHDKTMTRGWFMGPIHEYVL